jgi:hypothetical protein
MNAASVVWDAISGFLKAANAILSVVPGLVWAIALVAALVHGWYLGMERDHAVSEKNVAVANFEQLAHNVQAQKAAANRLLQSLTEQVHSLEAALKDWHTKQEIKDANDAKVISDQAARLRALAAASPGGQLRDPNATGCRRGGAGPDGKAAAAPGGGASDGAEGAGLLSAQLSGLLLRLTGEADLVNRAYAACRADAYTVRGLPAPADP